MTKEEAIKELETVFTPRYAKEIMQALKKRSSDVKLCGQCKYLGEKKTQIGNICHRKNWHWRTETAMYKYETTPACKAFEQREERGNV